jgi:hypothetical protein
MHASLQLMMTGIYLPDQDPHEMHASLMTGIHLPDQDPHEMHASLFSKLHTIAAICASSSALPGAGLTVWLRFKDWQQHPGKSAETRRIGLGNLPK